MSATDTDLDVQVDQSKMKISDEIAIQITDMNKWYGSFHVLKDINLTVHQGERIVVCGPSGSGKSTLIRCVNALNDFQSGSILVEGQEVNDPDLDKLELRKKVGMVFQQYNLFPHKTAIENIMMAPLLVLKQGKAEAEELARRLIMKVRLEGKEDSYPGELSGGQQQRVAIARAVIGRPDMLVADEPTGNVDPEMALKLIRLFEALNRLGTTVVVATHDVQLLKKVPDSLIMRLDKGHLSDPTGALRFPPRRELSGEDA